jgi:hypothetical protein
VHRQDQHAQASPTPAQLHGRLEPSEPWHRDVENREIDVISEGLLDRLESVGRLRDHLDVGLAVEHRTQTAANDRMIVREQYPRLERRSHASPRLDRDASRRSRCPPPRAARISSFASISIARSRMPRSPRSLTCSGAARIRCRSRSARFVRSGTSGRPAPRWRRHGAERWSRPLGQPVDHQLDLGRQRLESATPERGEPVFCPADRHASRERSRRSRVRDHPAPRAAAPALSDPHPPGSEGRSV